MRLLLAIFLVITIICFWKTTQIDELNNKKVKQNLKHHTKSFKNRIDNYAETDSRTIANRKRNNFSLIFANFGVGYVDIKRSHFTKNLYLSKKTVCLFCVMATNQHYVKNGSFQLTFLLSYTFQIVFFMNNNTLFCVWNFCSLSLLQPNLVWFW